MGHEVSNDVSVCPLSPPTSVFGRPAASGYPDRFWGPDWTIPDLWHVFWLLSAHMWANQLAGYDQDIAPGEETLTDNLLLESRLRKESAN